MPDLYLNGTPAADLSWYLMLADPPRDAPLMRWSFLTPARRVGGMPGILSVGPKRFTVQGRTVTSTQTVAARVAAEDNLKDVVVNGSTMTIRLDDGTTPVREIDAQVEGLTIRQIGHPLLAVASETSITFSAPDPTWRATEGTIVAVPSVNTRYSLPMGTGPTNLIIRQMGAATTPAVTVRRADGQVIAALALATLTSSEWYDIDSERGVLEKVSSGTITNGISSLTSGIFPVTMDPAWWSYRDSAWPTIETSAGSAEVLYSKRYW